MPVGLLQVWDVTGSIICFDPCGFVRFLKIALQLWPDAIKATCLHGLATYMLPFRAGDLTLPAILKSINNTSWIEGGRILIKSRILDVSSMGILMICAAVLTQVQISFSLRLGWMGVGIAMMISPVIISWLISSGARKSSSAFRKFILQFQTVSDIKRQEVIQSLGIWIGYWRLFVLCSPSCGAVSGAGRRHFFDFSSISASTDSNSGFCQCRKSRRRVDRRAGHSGNSSLQRSCDRTGISCAGVCLCGVPWGCVFVYQKAILCIK